jgi:dUTP pyrophosphatase
MVYTLEILAENDSIKALYKDRSNYSDDAGVDLVVPEDTTIGLAQLEATLLGYKIRCRMLNEQGEEVSYYLYARSSISKTPLMLANSVGIIDKSYRGEIKSALRNLYNNQPYLVMQGSRLVQICAPDLKPIRIKLVDELNSTARGEGGFGSTGK